MNKKDRIQFKMEYTNKELDEKIMKEAEVIVPRSILGTGTNKNQKIDIWDMLVRMKKPVKLLKVERK